MDPEPGLKGMVEAQSPDDQAWLSVVATGDDEGQHIAVLEDPEGRTFSVPMEWIPPELSQKLMSSDGRPDKGFAIGHKEIMAPPGELEKLWSIAAYNADLDGEDDLGPISYLERWKSGTLEPRAGDAVPIGDIGAMKKAFGAPEGALVGPAPTGQWRPKVPDYSGFVPRKKEDIPADAGSGWGNADETWNPRTQRWEKRRR